MLFECTRLILYYLITIVDFYFRKRFRIHASCLETLLRTVIVKTKINATSTVIFRLCAIIGRDMTDIDSFNGNDIAESTRHFIKNKISFRAKQLGFRVKLSYVASFFAADVFLPVHAIMTFKLLLFFFHKRAVEF